MTGPGCVADAPPPPPSRSSPAMLGHRWFAALWLELTTRPLAPPYPDSRYWSAYEFMGQRPDRERAAVALTLRAVLRTSTRWHFYTPRHVADFWDRYVEGAPPGRRRAVALERPEHLARSTPRPP